MKKNNAVTQNIKAVSTVTLYQQQNSKFGRLVGVTVRMLDLRLSGHGFKSP